MDLFMLQENELLKMISKAEKHQSLKTDSHFG